LANCNSLREQNWFASCSVGARVHLSVPTSEDEPRARDEKARRFLARTRVVGASGQLERGLRALEHPSPPPRRPRRTLSCFDQVYPREASFRPARRGELPQGPETYLHARTRFQATDRSRGSVNRDRPSNAATGGGSGGVEVTGMAGGRESCPSGACPQPPPPMTPSNIGRTFRNNEGVRGDACRRHWFSSPRQGLSVFARSVRSRRRSLCSHPRRPPTIYHASRFFGFGL